MQGKQQALDLNKYGFWELQSVTPAGPFAQASCQKIYKKNSKECAIALSMNFKYSAANIHIC